MALLKEAGLKLKRMSFQYLLQASREGGVASKSDDDIGDVDRLLTHIKVNSCFLSSEYLYRHLQGTPLSFSLVNEVSVFLLDRGMFTRAVDLLTSVISEPVDLGPLLKAIKNGVSQLVLFCLVLPW